MNSVNPETAARYSGSVPARDEAASGSTGALMDGIYRHQRHIYDATRKFYLLGATT